MRCGYIKEEAKTISNKQIVAPFLSLNFLPFKIDGLTSIDFLRSTRSQRNNYCVGSPAEASARRMTIGCARYLAIT